jgi:hypothetical protein
MPGVIKQEVLPSRRGAGLIRLGHCLQVKQFG